MALSDHTTTAAIRAVVSGVPSANRMDALRGANPAMYGEIQRVSQTPRRCRDLTADTVVELIGWLTESSVIHQVVASDTREAVSRAAKSRLSDLDAPPPPSANAANINTRTQRALAKTTVIDALQNVGTGNVDWTLVGEWFCAQAQGRRETLVLDLVKLATIDVATPEAITFVARMTTRSFTHQDGVEPVAVLQAANSTRAGVHALMAVDSITAPIAEYIAAGNFSAVAVNATSIDADAVAVLARRERFDVIVALEALEPDVVAQAIAHGSMRLSDKAIVLRYAKSARYVDALAPLLGTIDRAAEPASDALAVPGISAESRAILLATASAVDIMNVFAGDCGDTPSPEEVAAFAKRYPEGHITSTRNLVTTMIRNNTTGPEPLVALVRELWEHCPSMLMTVTSLSWASNWVIETCMADTAVAFRDLPDAWGVFFAAVRHHSGGSAGDLVRAVARTQ